MLVQGNEILARAGNRTRELNDPTAHAEILVIRGACEKLGSQRLPGCHLYVTLEPCVMCAGALSWSQISRVVYAASDDKRGFMRYGKELLHPKTKLEYGVLEEEAKQLIQRFFKGIRLEKSGMH